MVTLMCKPVDVVVVGIGVAGSIICKELAQAGLKVVGLERGRMLNPEQDFAMPYAHDELKYNYRSDILQNLSRETITFRNSADEIALPMREIGTFKPGECVGGAAVHWSGLTWRFLPWDFETRSHTIARYGRNAIAEDCTSQDWGISYEELEPYYDQFEYIYGIGGKAGNLEGQLQPGGNPFEGPRSREYPNPPTSPTYSESLFAEAAASFGYSPFPTPTATMTRAYINPYRLMLGECVRGGFCRGHGCAMGAKATPLTTVLPALLKHENFELRPHANVVRVNLDSDRKKATGVRYMDARGRVVDQPAELVVLTSYTFSNTRLMLLSGIGKPYDPASGEGTIGRNFADKSFGQVRLFFEDKVFNPFMGGGGIGTTIDDFNADNFDHAGLGFFGGAHLMVYTPGATPIRNRPVPSGTPRWGAERKRAMAQYYNRTFEITLGGSCQAYRGNHLDLDPTYRDAFGLPLLRMTFDWGANERKMPAFVAGKAVEIARAINPSRMNVNSVAGRFNVMSSMSSHNTGGVIMGADPQTSAVNKYLQSWDVPNVFVVGGSAFPQNASHHPTGTIGALACWAADAIKDDYLRNPRPLS